MEIIEKKIAIKLDKEERESLINTINLLDRMNSRLRANCDSCPFYEICQKHSDELCFFYMVARDLKYINNNCDQRKWAP